MPLSMWVNMELGPKAKFNQSLKKTKQRSALITMLFFFSLFLEFVILQLSFCPIKRSTENLLKF